MNPTNQNTSQNIDARYRTMLTLWFGLLVSIGMYFGVSVFAGPEISNDPDLAPNNTFTVVLTAIGTLFVLLSFVVKIKVLRRSVELQAVALVQHAMIIACGMCEVSALLGLIVRFTVGSPQYYLLFLISAIGVALHFPRRQQLLLATYKTSWNGAAS